MPVGAAARHEIEEIGQRREPVHVLEQMTRMADLDAVDPHLDERLEPRSPSLPAGMRPYSKPARFVHDRDCFAYLEAGLGHKCRTPSSQIAVERLAEIARGPGSNHCPCNVRTTNRRISGFFEYHLERHVDAERTQALDNSGGSEMALLSEFLQARLDESEPRYVEGENVYLGVAVVCAELDACHHPDSEGPAGFDRAWHARERVMIGQCECCDARRVCRRNDALRRQRSVRGGRVSVKIDESRRSRGCAAFSHRA